MSYFCLRWTAFLYTSVYIRIEDDKSNHLPDQEMQHKQHNPWVYWTKQKCILLPTNSSVSGVILSQSCINWNQSLWSSSSSSCPYLLLHFNEHYHHPLSTNCFPVWNELAPALWISQSNWIIVSGRERLWPFSGEQHLYSSVFWSVAGSPVVFECCK